MKWDDPNLKYSVSLEDAELSASEESGKEDDDGSNDNNDAIIEGYDINVNKGRKKGRKT